MKRIVSVAVFVIVMAWARATGAQSPDMIDLSQAQIVNAPDVQSWPVGATIQRVEFDGERTMVVFDRMYGPNRWPDVTPAGWDGPIQYTVWLFRFIEHRWVGSAFIEFWHGREWTGYVGDPDVPSVWHRNWYYDARWSPLYGSGPIQPLEKIGLMVTSGDARDKKGPYWSSQHPDVGERSNIVVFQAIDKGIVSFDAAPGPVPNPTPVPSPTPTPQPDYEPRIAALEATVDMLRAALAEAQALVQKLNVDLWGEPGSWSHGSEGGLVGRVHRIEAMVPNQCRVRLFGLPVSCQLDVVK